MCLAIPVKIKKIKNGWAEIEKGRRVNLSLTPKAKLGDWLLVHADLAVNILKEKEAQEILALVKTCHHQK